MKEQNKIQKNNKRRDDKIHLQKLSEISALRVDRSKFQMNKGKHKHVKQFNIIEDRMIQQENRRLMKRLNEIGNRKNELYKSLDEDNSFYTIQVKSREVYRRRKQQQIQQQNDHFVERLVRKISHKRSINLPEIVSKSRVKDSDDNKKKRSYSYATQH